MARKLDNERFVNFQSNDTSSLMEDIRIETEASPDITRFNGVPREHIEKRRVRIFKSAKNAMQSATFDTQNWKLGEFVWQVNCKALVNAFIGIVFEPS